jgi:hypothetical protein
LHINLHLYSLEQDISIDVICVNRGEGVFQNLCDLSGLRRWDYTKTVIYCGIQNNVLLLVYHTTIVHIQNQNKVVEFLVAWLFIMCSKLNYLFSVV